MPSEKGSKESTSSSSASPPSVIIWYISLSLYVITLNPAMNSSSLCLRKSSWYVRWPSLNSVIWSSSATRCRYSSSCKRSGPVHEIMVQFTSLQHRSKLWKYHARLVRPGPHFIQDKLKISIYLSLDKYKCIKLIQFRIFYI